jgi:hypothetical protein
MAEDVRFCGKSDVPDPISNGLNRHWQLLSTRGESADWDKGIRGTVQSVAA